MFERLIVLQTSRSAVSGVHVANRSRFGNAAARLPAGFVTVTRIINQPRPWPDATSSTLRS